MLNRYILRSSISSQLLDQELFNSKYKKRHKMYSKGFYQDHPSKRYYVHDAEQSERMGSELRAHLMSKLWLKKSGICDIIDGQHGTEATSFIESSDEIKHDSLISNNINFMERSDEEFIYTITLIHQKLQDCDNCAHKSNIPSNYDCCKIINQMSEDKNEYINSLTCNLLHTMLDKHINSENDRIF